MVEIDGRVSSVETEIASLQEFLTDLGALRVDKAANEEEAERIWQLRRDFSYSLRHTGLTS